MQVAQMAKAQGASFVAGSASSEEKREYARRSGVDLAVSSVESGWSGQVLEATHGRGVDVAYELSGAAFAELHKCLAPFGTLVKFGRA
jgi:NADPH2:quinone reductase